MRADHLPGRGATDGMVLSTSLRRATYPHKPGSPSNGRLPNCATGRSVKAHPARRVGLADSDSIDVNRIGSEILFGEAEIEGWSHRAFARSLGDEELTGAGQPHADRSGPFQPGRFGIPPRLTGVASKRRKLDLANVPAHVIERVWRRVRGEASAPQANYANESPLAWYCADPAICWLCRATRSQQLYLQGSGAPATARPR